METLTLCPRAGMAINIQPRVKRIAFGDGYEQRRPDGINHQLRKFEPVFRVETHAVQEMDAFLMRHAGVTAFLWQCPTFPEPVKVVCRSWSYAVDYQYVDFRCKFDEVVA